MLSAIYLLLGGKIDKKLVSFFIWCGAFVFISFITLIYSPENGVITGTMKLVLVSIIVAFCMSIFVQTKKDFYSFCWAYGLSSLACVVVLIITGNFFGEASDRLGQDEFGNANIFSSMMMSATFFSLWLLVYGKYKLGVKLFLFLIVVADIYALILSGGRTAFIISFVFLFVLLFFKRDKNGKRKIFTNVLSIFIIAWVVYYAIMNIPVLYNTDCVI